MGRERLDLNDAELGFALVRAAQLIVRHDGDRDHGNHSGLTCRQTMTIFDLCKAAAERLGADYEQITFGSKP